MQIISSASGTIGYGASVSGSVNQSKITSDYASVQEQSGIKAGDGGFQIKVDGNTDLKGAVIASTDAGTAANSLVTKTLTHSEIENFATMEASSIWLSGSVTSSGDSGKKDGKESGGKVQGPGGTDLIDVAKTSGTGAKPSAVALSENDKSTTVSGISAGAITIGDEAAQLALTGQSAAKTLAGLDRDVLTGTDSSARLHNNFDAAATQAALQSPNSSPKPCLPPRRRLRRDLLGTLAASRNGKQEKLRTASRRWRHRPSKTVTRRARRFIERKPRLLKLLRRHGERMAHIAWHCTPPHRAPSAAWRAEALVRWAVSLVSFAATPASGWASFSPTHKWKT